MKDAEKHWVQPRKYEVDAYIFFPPQMRVSKESYPIEQFYHDIRSFVRFREPKLSFKEILGMGRKAGRSPLLQIEKYIRRMKDGAIAEPPDQMIEEARIFGCSYFSYFQRRMERFEKEFVTILKSAQKDKEISSEALKSTLAEATENVEKSYQVLKTWRTIVGMTDDFPQGFLDALKAEIKEVNEYCSYIFRAGLLRLAHFLQELEGKVESKEYEGLRNQLQLYARIERWYSKRSGFFWIDEESNQQEREEFLYRRGILKRRTWSSLYLNSRMKPLFSFQQQLGAMLAAGIAGAWGVFATILVGTRIVSNPQSFLEFGTIIFVGALSLAYILKDRIKEMGRGYFKGGILGRMPDHSNRLYYNSPFDATPSVLLGTIQEKARHVTLSKLPPEIVDLAKRFDGEAADEHAGRSIIHYRKQVSLDKSAPMALARKIRAVHNVIRLYVDAFLAPLDARVQEVLVFTEGNRVKSVPAVKVYHLDLVLKKTSFLDKKRSHSAFEYYRIVLSKRGIERVETLLEPSSSQ